MLHCTSTCALLAHSWRGAPGWRITYIVPLAGTKHANSVPGAGVDCACIACGRAANTRPATAKVMRFMYEMLISGP
jgi:hypothetical protein